MPRELKIFLTRNRIQLIIAAVCVLVTIKQMHAPMFFPPNVVTSFLFERAPSGTVWGETLEILGNLGFAYYSSLIFYFIVDYFPTRQRENYALSTVSDHLSEIIICIERLFATLLFISGRGTRVKDLQKDTFRELCCLKLDNTELRFNSEIIVCHTQEVYMSGTAETLRPAESVAAICATMLNKIDLIFSYSNTVVLEEEIKNLLLFLRKNAYVLHASNLPIETLNKGMASLIVNCNEVDLLYILGVRLFLKKLPIEQYECIIQQATEQDIEEARKLYETMQETMPEAIALYEKIRDNP